MAKEADKQGRILNIGVCNRYNKSVEFLEEMDLLIELYHISRSA